MFESKNQPNKKEKISNKMNYKLISLQQYATSTQNLFY